MIWKEDFQTMFAFMSIYPVKEVKMSGQWSHCQYLPKILGHFLGKISARLKMRKIRTFLGPNFQDTGHFLSYRNSAHRDLRPDVKNLAPPKNFNSSKKNLSLKIFTLNV